MLKDKKILLLLSGMLVIGFAFAQRKNHRKNTHKPLTGLTASMVRGKAVYAKTCVTCHQADGGGLGNMNPPLIKTPYVLGDKGRMIRIVLNGFNEEVEIDDQVYHNTMPSQAYLKDQEIADVLTYVRNSFGNKASAVKPADVAAERGKK